MESNLHVNGQHDRSAKLRILIVEDDPDTADSMAILLRLYAYDVSVACDGVVALQVALEKQPDVVLLDLGLPKLNGWQLAKQLRSQISGKRPLLIAISGYGRESDQMRSQDAGIDMHLVKPVEPEMLQQVLKRFETILVPDAKDCPAS
jgi:two-component system OmpR family response regulator